MGRKITLKHMRNIMIRHGLGERALRRLMNRLDDEGKAEMKLLFPELDAWEEIVDTFVRHLAVK